MKNYFFIYLIISTFSLQALEDNYSIIEKIGEVEFGEVYTSENPQGDQFLLKISKMPLVFPEYEHEYEMGQLFDHPAIIKSVDLFRTYEEGDPLIHLVLEYVDAQTLAQTPDIPVEKGYQAVKDFCDAMQYTSALGYMHINLNENTVMFDQEQKIKISDLGSFFSKEEIKSEFDEVAPGFFYSIFYYESICRISQQILIRTGGDAVKRKNLFQALENLLARYQKIEFMQEGFDYDADFFAKLGMILLKHS